ncbi:bifunctional riboflavin kinase/FAD synthetase [Frigidibacter sp. MR17.14]|uniref:bifunctional riboflavin kinase/FAD synthetase n=1 Tax=Frigidibacter sp. MR17.14 TaxID=3126509 RepID=UPI003012A30E
MHRFTDWQGLAAKAQDAGAKGASVAMGNFDGLHLGHQAVIRAAHEACPDAPLGIVTFEPHPREFFARHRGDAAAPAFRLMNAEARANRLAKLGVERLYEIPFDAALAAMSAEDFVTRVLVEGLGVRHVTVGADFLFGHGRSGDAALLAELGARHGFGTTILPLLAEGATRVSSTEVRRLLSEGAPRAAKDLLGHWHRIEGPVIHGEKRGRELGYPTANMAVEGLHLPRLGVYAVKVDVLTGPQAGSYGGAASLGVRPMFGENTPNLETFVFDFSGDLYGQQLSVAFIDYLRPEMKFDGLPALLAQMDADCARARDILAAL